MSSCPHFDRATCRSCTLLERPHAEQLVGKTKRLAAVAGVTPEPAIASAPSGFRDKLKLTVGGSLDDLRLGLLAPDLREVHELRACQVTQPWFDTQLEPLKEVIRRARLVPYDIAGRRGELKGLILARSPQSGEAMARFVLRSREGLDRLRREQSLLPAFKVISANLQPIPHALLEGPEEILLTPDRWISHHTGHVRLAFAPKGFMQTNLRMADRLYQEATTWALELAARSAVDLFCGSGGFALHLAQQGLRVCGVELEAEAVAMAQTSAREQSLSASFICASADQVLPTLNELRPDVVVVNPPRRGLGAGLTLLLDHAPPIIIYSSCHIQSLEADLSQLNRSYDVKKTRVFDMFPHTDHFESLTLLVKRTTP